MSRVKDPQITLVGWIKAVGDPAKGREMIIVSVPPKITQAEAGSPVLTERTLLVNLPDEDQLELARHPLLDEGGRPIFTEIRCYLKLRVFDGLPPVVMNDVSGNRNRDPQEVLIGTVQPTKDGRHMIIVIDFPAENLFPSQGFLATTLIVNVPSRDSEDEVVDCYLKYRVVDADDRRAHLPAARHNHSTV